VTDEQQSQSPFYKLLSTIFSVEGFWIGAIVIVTTGFLSILPSILPVSATIEEWSRDIRIAAATKPEPQSEDIVFIALTDETLDLPQFPYRLPVDRSFMAELIRTLEAAGVRAIGIDILFDRWTEPEKDRDLIAALRETEIPVLPIWGDENIGVVGQRLAILEEVIGDGPTGFGLLLHDRSDGTVRNHRPVWTSEGRVRLSFPAAIAEAVGVPPENIPTEPHAIAWRGMPPDGSPPFRQYPAQAVQYLPHDWLEGKIALIGVDLVDIDRHRTPQQIVAGSGRIPGILVHAHTLSQILHNRYITETPNVTRVLILLIMAGIGVTIAIPQWPLWVKLGIGLGMTFGYLALVVWAYYEYLIMLPALMPGFSLLLAASLGSVFVGRQERAKRAYIRSAFSRYIAPAVVARLDKNPDALVLGGERREVTFMFSDLEGFTSMSEKLTPSELADVINAYLDGAGDIILKHGGTIDKFIGDGIMSFFGAPEAHDDDPDRTVACALEFDAFSNQFSKEWRAKGVPVGITRIGIHTGQAIVGNFGGRQRFDYTALGDVVNAASRMEGANKQFGTHMLVSEETRKLTHRAHFRPVGDIVLVGKDEAIPCFEPIHDEDIRSDRVQTYREIFEMIRAGDPKALDAFKAYTEKYPDDPLGRYHYTRLKSGETGTRIVLTSK
jgi:class 3 adenylate cyclase/CHASE2 domain-containing sensor protein